MEISFIPSQCKGDDRKFEGSIQLRVLSVIERYRLMAKSSFQIGADGVIKKDITQLAAIADLLDNTKQYFVKVDIKSTAGKEYKSFDDLANDPECDMLLIETATQFLNGFKLGNE